MAHDVDVLPIVNLLPSWLADLYRLTRLLLLPCLLRELIVLFHVLDGEALRFGVCVSDCFALGTVSYPATCGLTHLQKRSERISHALPSFVIIKSKI